MTLMFCRALIFICILIIAPNWEGVFMNVALFLYFVYQDIEFLAYIDEIQGKKKKA